MTAHTTPLELPSAFDGWSELDTPGIRDLRILIRGTATATVVSGNSLVDVIVADGQRRLVLTLTPDEVVGELARVAAEIDAFGSDTSRD